MKHRRRGPDGHAHGTEAQHHGTEPDSSGHWLTTQPRPRRRSLVGHLAVKPGVHSLVDFFADALDETLGHGGVVAGAEVVVCRRRGPHFIPDAHEVTLSAGRAENTGANTRFPARAGLRKAGQLASGRPGKQYHNHVRDMDFLLAH